MWGYENYPCTRTVDNHILRLRQKLEAEFANPVHFRTVHGTGYKFTSSGPAVGSDNRSPPLGKGNRWRLLSHWPILSSSGRNREKHACPKYKSNT